MSRFTKRSWYLWLGAAGLLSALALSPLVIPVGVLEPTILGVPRTLWAGILITIGLVFTTFMAARHAPDDSEFESDGGSSR
ncbi:MAG: hypothetical protein WED81_05185 [Rhodothermales bacterium]